MQFWLWRLASIRDQGDLKWKELLIKPGGRAFLVIVFTPPNWQKKHICWRSPEKNLLRIQRTTSCAGNLPPRQKTIVDWSLRESTVCESVRESPGWPSLVFVKSAFPTLFSEIKKRLQNAWFPCFTCVCEVSFVNLFASHIVGTNLQRKKCVILSELADPYIYLCIVRFPCLFPFQMMKNDSQGAQGVILTGYPPFHWHMACLYVYQANQ